MYFQNSPRSTPTHVHEHKAVADVADVRLVQRPLIVDPNNVPIALGRFSDEKLARLSRQDVLQIADEHTRITTAASNNVMLAIRNDRLAYPQRCCGQQGTQNGVAALQLQS